MALVPVISFLAGGWMIGWASTPYDPFWARANRRAAAGMALAGPAANLLLVFLAGLGIRLGILFGVFAAPQQVTWTQVTAAPSSGFFSGMAIAVSVLFSLNLILLIFNLLPLPPLDGSEILALVLNDSAAERYREFLAQPAVAIIGLIVAWNVIDAILGPVQLLALTLLYPGVRYS
jgi:Zn-dependent protease